MFRFNAIFIAASLSSAALAQSAPSRAPHLGEHPAVIVKRLEAGRGYDYASKFYPHPAWLYLGMVPPDQMLQAAARRARPDADAARDPLAAAVAEEPR